MKPALPRVRMAISFHSRFLSSDYLSKPNSLLHYCWFQQVHVVHMLWDSWPIGPTLRAPAVELGAVAVIPVVDVDLPCGRLRAFFVFVLHIFSERLSIAYVTSCAAVFPTWYESSSFSDVYQSQVYKYGRFPKFHRVLLGRDPGTLKSDIVSKKHPQLICSDLRLSN